MNVKLESLQKSKTGSEDYARAIKEAQSILIAKGIHYPSYKRNRPIAEFYDLVKAYGEQEAALVQKILKPIAEPRPLVVNTVKTKQWAKPYYDD